jgi:hypothetical protein
MAGLMERGGGRARRTAEFREDGDLLREQLMGGLGRIRIAGRLGGGSAEELVQMLEQSVSGLRGEMGGFGGMGAGRDWQRMLEGGGPPGRAGLLGGIGGPVASKAQTAIATTLFLTDDRTGPADEVPYGASLVCRLFSCMLGVTKVRGPRPLLRLLATTCR